MRKTELEERPAAGPALAGSAHRDTIFALASGSGVAGIAVIRVSGPSTDAALARLTGHPLPEPRRAALRNLKDEAGELIDQAIVLRFAVGEGYSGEAAAEIQCHGGRAVVTSVLELLGRQPGFRLAEPGEFTRRAFEAGRLDLAEIEALGDLLAAETEMQRRQAMRGFAGAMHRQAEAWRADLVRAAALVEATIDWADEDVPENVGPEVAGLVASVRSGILRELSLSEGAERLRNGFEVAILGAPNTGKSSLFNAFAGRDAAITSVRPGTTRDVLELRYDLVGVPVVFLDTAGLRETGDETEAVGIARAIGRARAAAMRLFLRSADAPPLIATEADLWQPGDLRVWTKGDLGAGPGDLVISALTGDGLPELLDQVNAELSGRAAEGGLVGHIRQRRELERAIEALARAESALETGEAEIVAEDIRSAFRALERLIGRVGAEDVLGAVFAAFCLGK
jgi:tRNA modification GTPase